jgi:indolepyruvate ferredoxin oxidoreductase
VTVLDMTGLAQKGGAVYSHVRIADRPDDLHATRVAAGEADAVIGGDIIVSAGAEAINKMRAGFTRAVVNCAEIPTLDFLRDPDWRFPLDAMQQGIAEAVGKERVDFIDAQHIATQLMGDAIATNLFLLGYAWQRGLVPVSHASLQRAIELNAVAVEMNRAALLWGRRAAHDLEAVRRALLPAALSSEVVPTRPPNLDDIIDRREAFLVDYQDAAYARRYRDAVERMRWAEAPFDSTRVTEAVARNYFKLLAYKDEYEVARLHSDPAFRAQIDARFEGDFKVNFHLAPPLLARPDPVTGRIAKRVFGQYMFIVFRCLAPFKRLRGTRWNPFGYSQDRRLERMLIREYEDDMARLCTEVTSARIDLAAEIASLPQQIRGYGPIKRSAAASAGTLRAALWSQWETRRETPAAISPTAASTPCAASTT